MKRIVACIILSAFGLLILSACSSQTASTPESEPFVTGGGVPGTAQADVSDTQSDSGSTSGAASGAQSTTGGQTSGGSASEPATGAGATVVSGVIEDSGMGKIYVQLEGGVIVGFDYTAPSTDISGLTDTMPGASITVTYSGTLEGDNADGITVIKMETPK